MLVALLVTPAAALQPSPLALREAMRAFSERLDRASSESLAPLLIPEKRPRHLDDDDDETVLDPTTAPESTAGRRPAASTRNPRPTADDAPSRTQSASDEQIDAASMFVEDATLGGARRRRARAGKEEEAPSARAPTDSKPSAAERAADWMVRKYAEYESKRLDKLAEGPAPPRRRAWWEELRTPKMDD